MTRTREVRLAVLGSTSWTDWDLLKRELDRVMADHYVGCIVVTNQPGAPELGKRYGELYGLPVLQVGGHGESFREVENEVMEQSNLVIGFEKPGMKAFGLARARDERKLLRVVTIQKADSLPRVVREEVDEHMDDEEEAAFLAGMQLAGSMDMAEKLWNAMQPTGGKSDASK